MKLLVRGAWGGKGAPPDEINNRDCYSMCKLFRDGSTVNIAGLRARPAYLGCWLKEAQNGEEIKSNMFGNTLDCEGYSAPNPGRAIPAYSTPPRRLHLRHPSAHSARRSQQAEQQQQQRRQRRLTGRLDPRRPRGVRARPHRRRRCGLLVLQDTHAVRPVNRLRARRELRALHQPLQSISALATHALAPIRQAARLALRFSQRTRCSFSSSRQSYLMNCTVELTCFSILLCMLGAHPFSFMFISAMPKHCLYMNAQHS